MTIYCSFTQRLRHDEVMHDYYPSYQISEETSLRKLRDSSIQTNKYEDVKDIVQDTLST